MKKILSKWLEAVDNYSQKSPHYFFLIILVIPVLLMILQYSLQLNKVNLHEKDASIVFLTGEFNEKNEHPVSIVISAENHSVAFARIAFTFDPRSLQLIADPKINPNLSTVIEKTHLLEANNTGRYVLVAAASPLDHPPTNDFEFAGFVFKKLSDENSPLAFDNKDIQLVSKKIKNLSFEITDTSIL